MGMDDEERAHQRHILRAVSKWFNIDYAFQLLFLFEEKAFNCYSSPFYSILVLSSCNSCLYVLKRFVLNQKVNMKSYTLYELVLCNVKLSTIIYNKVKPSSKEKKEQAF